MIIYQLTLYGIPVRIASKTAYFFTGNGCLHTDSVIL